MDLRARRLLLIAGGGWEGVLLTGQPGPAGHAAPSAWARASARCSRRAASQSEKRSMYR